MKYKLSCLLRLFLTALCFWNAAADAQSIQPGASQMQEYLPLLRGRSVAIFANQTSTVGSVHLVDTLIKLGVHVTKIFAPEHGFRGTADAGEHVGNQTDPATGIQIVSLYGSKTKPSAEDLQNIDVMIFDIQDVGVRFYTYISSLQGYMESAIENKKTLLILDRPNPNGFYVDGPVLDKKFSSFVGMQAVPVVYGMTIGEYAQMMLKEDWCAVKDSDHAVQVINAVMNKKTTGSSYPRFRLIIVTCKNYTHKSRYQLPIRPSPNLPNMASVYLYPSLCFFEGTAISLGRGTDKPFQQFGHPDLPATGYEFIPESTEGAKNPPLLGETCHGYDLHKDKSTGGQVQQLQLRWLLQAYKQFPDKEKFFLPSNFFNKLAGTDSLMMQIKMGLSESDIRKTWQPALKKFKAIRKKYLLYPDFG